MNKDIKYLGYTAQPSDYECQDGELAMSLNLLNENGTVSSIRKPKPVMQLGSPDHQVLFIHQTNSYKHYIIIDASTQKLSWRDSSSGATFPGVFNGVTHCNAVGNTLLVFTEKEINYFLWKDNAYISLGNALPEITLSFGLIGHPRLFSISDSSAGTFKVQFAEGIDENSIFNELSDANKTNVTEQIMAKVNKFIREQTLDQGRFCFPFFVRYALRLYDGSLVGHSAPILMNPQTLPAPLVLWKRLSGKNSYSEAVCDIMLMACDLDYSVSSGGDCDKLDIWSDIITGIEVFISKPIYTYDQDGKISHLKDTDNFDTTFIGRLFHKGYNSGEKPSYPESITEDAVHGPMSEGQTSGFLDCYAEWNYRYIYALYFSADRSYPSTTFHLPEFSEEKIGESLRTCSIFYKLRTLAVSDLKPEERVVLPVEGDYLQSLVTREVMTDDYLSHDRLSATSSLAYNSRINLSGVKRKLFAGFSPSSMFAFTDRYIERWQQTGNAILVEPSSFPDYLDVSVFVKEGGKTYLLQSSGSCGAFLSPRIMRDGAAHMLERNTGCYIFYPNVNAVKLVISSIYGGAGATSGGGSLIIDLKPHEFLNGAYALLDYNRQRINNFSPDLVPEITASPDDRVDCGSGIYTSEVNNPFFFPVTGINTVGTGRIRGIATAAKALSQGQFGQFPLYVFSDDGIWAMEVTPTGTYSAKQPITRDVCINPDGITQIDSAVLFPTDRGIMLISGSQTQCISEAINSEHPFDIRLLPGMDKLHAQLRHDSDSCMPTVPFSKFLRECGMIYDYVHQRIIVFNRNYTYAYIYSLKTKAWGMIYSDIQTSVNSYPEALAVDGKGNLVDFTQDDVDAEAPGLLVTRPLNLDVINIHKTIDSIIQRGNFAKGNVRSVLYGSRDLINWHLVWSSKDHYLRGFRGTPYKYFRIALLCNLAPGESIYGASVRFTPRLTNQPR